MKPPFFAQLSEALCAIVEYTVRYQFKGKDGITRTEHNARFGKSHLTPEPPEIPDSAAHILSWFWQLNATRKSGMSGVDPIGYTEIGEWARLTRNDPSVEEVSILLDLDSAYTAAISDETSDKPQDETNGRLQAPPT